jgi:hypothetical protein
VWARAVSEHEKRPVLILTPLAVAEQTVDEARKFKIGGVFYRNDRAAIQRSDRIVVTNYERFHRFIIDDFAGIVLDESSIIKSQEGATRRLLTDACSQLQWKLCCSATPAPNDYIELGQHAEFLGAATAPEMLATYFVHEGSIRAVGERPWRLKRHAERAFWRWLASWAVVIQHPRDLGFEELGYDLPPLRMHQVFVGKPIRRSGGFLPYRASTLRDRIKLRKSTFVDRVDAVVHIVSEDRTHPWLIWCNLNSEADALELALSGSKQVAGAYSTELKVSRLRGFTKGAPRILVSKPTIAGHGLNWQHCSHMVFVGLTDSFEQVFQAIRRCWRFGQRSPVDCYFVAAEGEDNVVANLKRKEQAYLHMQAQMVEPMREFTKSALAQNSAVAIGTSGLIALRRPSWL